MKNFVKFMRREDIGYCFLLGIAFVGKLRTRNRDRYQIGMRFRGGQPIYLNLVKKPKFRNLVVLNILLFFPFLINSIVYMLKELLGYLWYSLYGHIEDNDYNVMPIIWEILAILFITLYLLK